MKAFGSAVLLGLGIGLVWGVGCAIALLYAIFLAGYRKAVEDSLAEVKPKRFQQILEKLRAEGHGDRLPLP
ncbi:MAG TPA: hypothetical protein VL991_09660 [Terracidiphilus sp.]|jgi:hypothetical protein|nr:hypothetical protein [Terracidiphilus sp.]